MENYPHLFGRIILLAGLLLLASIGARARQRFGYLPSGGPAPLRFEAPRPAGMPNSLPPPTAPQPLSAASVPTTGATFASPADTNATPASPLSPVPTPALESFGPFIAFPSAGVEPTNEVRMLHPNSFLIYLKPLSNNAPVGNLIIPAFVPPAPTNSAPSSRAIYEIR